MIELKIRAIVGSDSGSDNAALVLADTNNERQLLIIVDNAAGKKLYSVVNNIFEPVSTVYDIFYEYFDYLGHSVKFIKIYSFRNGIFSTSITLVSKEGSIINFESRVSDAIILAMMFKASIYCDESVINEAGINLESVDSVELYMKNVDADGEPLEDSDFFVEKVDDGYSRKKDISEMSMVEIERALKNAISSEDYSLASALRDERNRRNKK